MQRIRQIISGEVLAESVAWEDYLRDFAADHAEWVEGTVVRLPPVSRTHTRLFVYFSTLLDIYLSQTQEGEFLVEPFVMRLADISAREPDLLVVTTPNKGRLHETYLDGPADLVIEIIAPGRDTRDRVEKFSEYERGGVGEYWIVDPRHREALFYRRSDGVYVRASLTQDGVYQSAVLPRLQIVVTDLWRSPLPNPAEIERAVAAMLEPTP
jgi:Uma2 family endonuclease